MKNGHTKILKVTTHRWVRIKDKLQFEVKAKDFLGNKFTFTVDSKEPVPHPNQKKIVSDMEWKRIQYELKDLLDKKYAEILKSMNDTYLKKVHADEEK